MREQLIKYVELLFAGTTDTYEIKQEILQNTLDRYDDLIDQGKSPEAAYRLAISGIGDINEILSNKTEIEQPAAPKEQAMDGGKRKLLRAIAIALYILCPTPLFITDGSTQGLCITLLFVAVATALMIIAGKNAESPSVPQHKQSVETCSPHQQLRKAAGSIIWIVGMCIYFILSFATMAWYITWIIFPILGAVQGLVTAILDLKEASKNEN